MKTVMVRFGNSSNAWGKSKDYEYYIPDDMKVSEGDKVVVDFPYDGYMVVTVVSTKLEGKASKSVVCRIDDTDYKKRLEEEKSRAAILKELEKIEKKIKEESRFEYLRAISPEAERLLTQLETGKF